MTPAEKKRLILLVAGAAVIRVLYLWFYSQQEMWGEQVVDALFHLNWADQIAGGEVVGNRPFFKSPLYVYALAFWRWLFSDSILAPRLFGSALGLISILLTYLLTRKITEQLGWKKCETAALIAGGAQALYPSVVFFEAELLVDFMFTVLAQAAVYLALVNNRPSIRKWFVVGIVLGLASLTRATGLVLIPLFGYWAWRDKTKVLSRSTGLKAALALILGAAAVIAPVTARNYALSGEFVLIATSGGVNFYIGNNSSADPVSAALPEPFGTTWRLQDMRGLAERDEGHKLSDGEVSSYWARKGLGWIAENPGGFLRSYLHKLYTLLSAHTYSNNRALEVVFQNNPVLRFSPLNFAFLFGLAALGWMAGGRKSRVLRRALMVAGWYGLALCFFFINERFRLLPLTLLFPAAGLGSLALIRWIKKALGHPSEIRARVTVAMILTAIAVSVIAVIPFGRPVENPQARALYLQANSRLRQGDFEGAEVLYRKLLALDPKYPRAALNLGVAELRTGKSEEAEKLFLQELSVSPGQPDALTNLASLTLINGDHIASDSLSALAYRLRPYDLTTIRIRIRSLTASSKLEELRTLENAAQERWGADPRFWLELGLAYLQIADTAKARRTLEDGLDNISFALSDVEIADWAYGDPEQERKEIVGAHAEMLYRLGFLYGVGGRYQDAAEMSAQAIQRDSSLVEAYVNLTLAYVALGKTDSATALYLEALRRFDNDARAIGILRSIDPAGARN